MKKILLLFLLMPVLLFVFPDEEDAVDTVFLLKGSRAMILSRQGERIYEFDADDLEPDGIYGILKDNAGRQDGVYILRYQDLNGKVCRRILTFYSGKPGLLPLVTYKTDNIIPEIRIISGPDSSVFVYQPQVLVFEVSEDRGYISTNGCPFFSFPQGTYTLDVDAMTEIVYYARDTAGNSSPVYSLVISFPDGLASPDFSLPGGFYNSNVTIVLSSPDTNVSVHYTLDGSNPGPGSPVYSSPLTTVFGNINVIRAVSIDPSGQMSKERSQTYFIFSQIFDPDLPIILLWTSEASLSKDWYISGRMGVIDWKGTFPDEVYTDIDIRYRGSSSLSFAKKQFRIETQDEYGSNRNLPLLDMPRENDWVLYAPYSDKSLMRNVLSYELYRQLGYYTPRTRYCEMYMNGDYRGVYVLTEKIKRDDDRVNIAENPPGISDGGFLFKYDRGDPVFYTPRAEFVPIYPDENAITPAQISYLENYLVNFENLLYGGDHAWTNYIDVQSFVDTFILVQLLKNIDGFRLSAYYYKDQGQKIVSAPAWDYNLSMGNADYADGWLAEGWYDDSWIPWWQELHADTWFMAEVGKRWREIRQSEFNLANLMSLMDDSARLLENAQERNFIRWPILGTYVWPNAFIANTWQEELDFMRSFMYNRYNWFDSQFNVTNVQIDFKIIPSDAGVINIADLSVGASNFTGTFIQGEYFDLSAEALPGWEFVEWNTGSFSNYQADFITAGSAWRYLDDGSDQDSAWTAPGFNDSSWYLGNAQLGYGDGDETTVISYGGNPVDKYATTYFRRQFTVPDPSAYDFFSVDLLRDDGAVVYLNGNEIRRDNMSGGAVGYADYAAGTVTGGSESAYYRSDLASLLLSPGMNTLAVEVHQAAPDSSDISFDLVLYGSGVVFNGGTAISNRAPGCLALSNSTMTAVFQPVADVSNIFINEFMAINGSVIQDEWLEEDDWIEIYNAGSSAVDIGGLFISDDFSDPRKYMIPDDAPAATTIMPGAFLVLWADNTPLQGTLHLPFALSGGGEELILCQAVGSGNNILDAVAYGQQTNDVSWGRSSDGGGNWQLMFNPTPAAANIP